MAKSNRLLVAFAAQTDILGGVATSHRLGWIEVEDGLPDSDSVITKARELLDVPNEYRIVSELVCPMQPFDKPTECEVAITLMPGGAAFTARLRRSWRKFVISDQFTLVDAFADLMSGEISDSVIGWSYTPTTF